MELGFIGLGIMGKPMSVNLLKSGYEVTVIDINQSAVEELVKQGARGAQSSKEVGENSELIFTMLPKGIHVKGVIFGSDDHGGLIQFYEKLANIEVKGISKC